MFNDRIRDRANSVKTSVDFTLIEKAKKRIPSIQKIEDEPYFIAKTLASELKIKIEDAASIFYAWNLYLI